jgi:hypothetical protein
MNSPYLESKLTEIMIDCRIVIKDSEISVRLITYRYAVFHSLCICLDWITDNYGICKLNNK